MRTANRLCLCALLLLAVSCGGRKKAAPAAKDRPFPQVVIPAAYTDPDERISYAIEHYWDGFFGGDGRTDSARVLGVPKGEVEQALANYIGVLGRAPLPQAGKAVSGLFDALAAKQAADTSNRVYLAMTEMVARRLRWRIPLRMESSPPVSSMQTAIGASNTT